MSHPRLLVVTAVAPEAAAVLRGVRAALPDAAGPTGEPSATALPGGRVLHRWGPVDVLAAGVGPAAAAAGTATALVLAGCGPDHRDPDHRDPDRCGPDRCGPQLHAPDRPDPHRYDLVVSAGIAGGFAPLAPLGSLVVADAIVAADLGAETDQGFVDVAGLGFGQVRHPTAHSAAAAAALLAAGLPCAVGPVLTVSTVTGTAARAAELTGRHPDALAEAMEGFGVAEAAVGHGTAVLELRAVSNAVGPRDRAAWRIGDAFAALERGFAVLPYQHLG